MKQGKKIFAYLGKHGATLLSVAAAAGVVLTAVETAKATTKAQSLIDMNKAEPMSKKEVVEENKKTQKELMAAYVAVQQTYSAYRRKVAEQVGEEAEKDIHRQVEAVPHADNGDVEHLCYEPHTNRYFKATMAQVYKAAYMLNKKLALDGGVSLEAWCEMLGLEFIPDDKCRGWCIDQMVEEWEYFWLDVECYEQKTDDVLLTCCIAAICVLVDRERRKLRRESGEEDQECVE